MITHLGNPNEETVGMFGVGFYSVFSLAENPMVVSSGQKLAFLWDKDQLTTYSAKMEDKQYTADPLGAHPWTTMVFPIR